MRQLNKRVGGVADLLPAEAAPAAIAARATAVAASAIPGAAAIEAANSARAQALERIASHIDASSGGLKGGPAGAAAFWGEAVGAGSATVRAAAMAAIASTADLPTRAALQAGGAAHTVASWLAAAVTGGCTTDMVAGLGALEALVTSAPLPVGGPTSSVAKATKAAAAALGLAPPPGLAIVIAPPKRPPPPPPVAPGERKRVRDREGERERAAAGGTGLSRLAKVAYRPHVPPAPTPADFVEPLPWNPVEAAGPLLAPPFALRTAAAGAVLKRRAVAAATKRAAALAGAAVSPAAAAAFPPPAVPAVACNYPLGTGQDSAEGARLAGAAVVAVKAEGVATLADPPAGDAAAPAGASPTPIVSFAPTEAGEFEQLRAAMAAQGVRDARLLDWGRELVTAGAGDNK